MTKKELKRAFLATVPVLSGYVVIGIGFGMVLQAKGYGVWWAVAMSGLIYAGAMQYVAIDLITAGASLITVALTALLVNARHLFYGISMVDRYKCLGKMKIYDIFSLTDETYSLVCGELPEDEGERRRYITAVSVFDQAYWIAGSVLGSLAGKLVPFSVEGIEFALTALFVTVFTEQWLTAKDHVPAIVGFGSTLICLLVFGAEKFLIPAMAVITLALTLLRGRLEAKDV